MKPKVRTTEQGLKVIIDPSLNKYDSQIITSTKIERAKKIVKGLDLSLISEVRKNRAKYI